MRGCVKKNRNTEMVYAGKKGNGQVGITSLNSHSAKIYSDTSYGKTSRERLQQERSHNLKAPPATGAYGKVRFLVVFLVPKKLN